MTDIFFRAFRVLFDESSRTFRNIPQFQKLSTLQKCGLITIYVIISVHLGYVMARILFLLPYMGNAQFMGMFYENQPFVYLFEKYFIKGDAYVLVAFLLILLPWVRLNYYVTFRMGDFFPELLADVESILDCTIDWKTLIQMIASERESLSIRKRASKAITLLERSPCQWLHFRYNPVASRREKATVKFIYETTALPFNIAYFLLKLETGLVPLVLAIFLPEPITPHLSLWNMADFGLLMSQVFLYIHLTTLTMQLGFLDGMLPAVSLPASYRRFRRLLTSGSHASKLYPAMVHHQRLFINAAYRFILNSRKLIPYSFTVQFFSAVTALTGLLASLTMTGQTGSAGESVLIWPMISVVIAMLTITMIYAIGYSKILYYHTPLVISSNVRLAMAPGMLTRKVKGNTIVETLNIRKKISISFPFIGRLNTKNVGSCLVVYSSLFLSCVEKYY